MNDLDQAIQKYRISYKLQTRGNQLILNAGDLTLSFDKKGNEIPKIYHLMQDGKFVKVFDDKISLHHKNGTHEKNLNLTGSISSIQDVDNLLIVGSKILRLYSTNDALYHRTSLSPITAIGICKMSLFPIATAHEDGKIRFQDFKGNQEPTIIENKEKVKSISYQNGHLFVTGEDLGYLYTNKSRQDCIYNNKGIIFNDYFLSQNRDGFLYLYDLKAQSSTVIDKYQPITKFRTNQELFAVQTKNTINVIHAKRLQTSLSREFHNLKDFRLTQDSLLVLTETVEEIKL